MGESVCVCSLVLFLKKKKRKERGFALLKAEIIMLTPSIAPQLQQVTQT